MNEKIINDDVMDPTLQDFYNKYYISNPLSNVSSAFSKLSIDERLKLFEEYLIYYFRYLSSLNSRQFSFHNGIDNDGWKIIRNAGVTATVYPDLYYKDISYDIDSKNSVEFDGEDSFNLTIRYTERQDDLKNIKDIRSISLWLSYDLFESASIGFNFIGAYDDDKVRDKIKEIFKRVYDNIMNDDVLHAWFILSDLEHTLREILLNY